MLRTSRCICASCITHMSTRRPIRPTGCSSATERRDAERMTVGTIYRPRRTPKEETCELRGLAIRLTRWPGADTRPWLLLHGWLDAGSTFQFLADALPVSRSLIAPDWRGFGGSAWAQDGYWFPDYYADLDALIDRRSPQRSEEHTSELQSLRLPVCRLLLE